MPTTTWLSFTAAVSVTLGALTSAAGAATIQLLVHGLAAPNQADAPKTAAFTAWCAGACFPTTHQTAVDPSSGRPHGEIFVWGKNLQPGAGGSLCFGEFIVFALQRGELHVASGDRGTCGAPIDPTLKPPLYPEKGAQFVLAGGGDGVIVGGTRKYAKWKGTYTDRAYVGFGDPTSGVGGLVYYDQLWFSIARR